MLLIPFMIMIARGNLVRDRVAVGHAHSVHGGGGHVSSGGVSMSVSRVPSPLPPENNMPVAENWCYTQVRAPLLPLPLPSLFSSLSPPSHSFSPSLTSSVPFCLFSPSSHPLFLHPNSHYHSHSPLLSHSRLSSPTFHFYSPSPAPVPARSPFLCPFSS